MDLDELCGVFFRLFLVSYVCCNVEIREDQPSDKVMDELVDGMSNGE